MDRILLLLRQQGNRRLLAGNMTSVSGIAWSPTGNEVWCSGINEDQQNGIWGITLDGSRRAIHTSPARVSLHDVKRDGRALIGLYDLVGVVWLMRRTRLPVIAEALPEGRHVSEFASRMRGKGAGQRKSAGDHN